MRKTLSAPDVGNSVYSIVREKNGIPAFTAAYNTSGIGKVEDSPFNSLRKIQFFQCTNKGRTLQSCSTTAGSAVPSMMRLALMVYCA